MGNEDVRVIGENGTPAREGREGRESVIEGPVDIRKWIIVTADGRKLIGCPRDEEWEGVTLEPVFEMNVMTQVDGQNNVLSRRVILPIDMIRSTRSIVVRCGTRYPVADLADEDIASLASDVRAAMNAASTMRTGRAAPPRLFVPRG